MTEPDKSPTVPNAESLSRAIAAWRTAQIVHPPPSWQGQPEARALAEEVALQSELEEPLWKLLGDRNQLLVAYALIALELMGSDRLASLPEALLVNRLNITLQFGGVRSKMELGGFARQIQERAKRASANQAPAQGNR